MGILVYFLVPETKGRSLESMDLVFGTAYENATNTRELELELGDYRKERGLGGEGRGGKVDEGNEGDKREGGVVDENDADRMTITRIAE
jgi:hypothetical protein